MTKQIPLGKTGKSALVDDSDYDWLNQWKWFYHMGYAARRVGTWPNRKRIFMHRFIMDAPPEMEVDHKDNNKPDHGLDNQRSNLRLCTTIQNIINSGKRSNNTSGYKGVVWHEPLGKWRAQASINGKRKHLGLFDDPQEAARVYDAAASKYYGEFANTNFEVVTDQAKSSLDTAENYVTHSASGYRGVSFDKLTGKWDAGIGSHLNKKYIGAYDDPEVAARAYDMEATKRYGKRAKLNFPKERHDFHRSRPNPPR